jgi:hypothetical protein
VEKVLHHDHLIGGAPACFLVVVGNLVHAKHLHEHGHTAVEKNLRRKSEGISAKMYKKYSLYTLYTLYSLHTITLDMYSK